jgi:hypothetical protein
LFLADVASRVSLLENRIFGICIAGGDREYGRVSVKLSELLKPDGVQQILGIAIKQHIMLQDSNNCRLSRSMFSLNI